MQAIDRAAQAGYQGPGGFVGQLEADVGPVEDFVARHRPTAGLAGAGRGRLRLYQAGREHQAGGLRQGTSRVIAVQDPTGNLPFATKKLVRQLSSVTIYPISS